MKNIILTISAIIGIYSDCYSQDYRDRFIGSYFCDIHTVYGPSNTWDTGTIVITKSDTNPSQIIISRSQTQYSIATVDTTDHFVVSSTPFGEWGDIYPANDSLYYFRNGGSAMGLFFYYYGKKTLTSIDELQQVNNPIKLYPNPTHDKLYLLCKCLDNNSIINIYDLNGKLFYSKSIDSEENFSEVDIKILPKGIYFITLLSNGRSFNSKFIKQ